MLSALVAGRGARATDAIPVASWPFCLVYLHTQRCACGGAWHAGTHVLHGRLESHQATCEGCGTEREFWFDLSLVVDDPEGYSRFEDLRELFTQAVSHIDRGAALRSIPLLEEVAAREPWFGLAWLHLGVAQMLEEEHAQARSSLERAVGLLPMDPTARNGLADCYLALGLNHRAAREFEIADKLTERTGGRGSS